MLLLPMYGRQERDRDFQSLVALRICSAGFSRPNKKGMRWGMKGVNRNSLE